MTELWRSEGTVIRPGVALAEIEAFRQRSCVVLPNDLRSFFLFVDGMEHGDCEEDLNRFWMLSEVKPVHDELSDTSPDRWAYPDCFVFADHSIWCFGWAVRLDSRPRETSGPVFQVIGDDPPGRMVAVSFTAFIEMYLYDRTSVM